MKILILDDHSLFAQGLGKILEDNIVGAEIITCHNITDIYHKCTDLQQLDLFISDIELPDGNIFDLLSQIRQELPKLPILVISMHNKLSTIKKCQQINIQGYILKDDDHLIMYAVNELLIGRFFYSEKVRNTLKILDKKELVLTPKEEEIIKLLAKGFNNQEIANKIFVSHNTVKTHRKNIYRKLDLGSTVDIIKYYFENYICDK